MKENSICVRPYDANDAPNQDLIRQIRDYRPFNEQEEMDRKLILRCLEMEKDVFTRKARTSSGSGSSTTSFR